MQTSLAKDCMINVLGNAKILAQFYSFLAKNPHLSFWEAAQIFSVYPKADICMSYDDWQVVGKQVSRGERGIPYFDENNPFRKKYVFDIKQTYGKGNLNKKSLSEKQLLKLLNNLNILQANDKDTEASIFTAVEYYCREHFTELSEVEKDEEYIACLTEGITQYLYEYSGIQRQIDVGALPFGYTTNFNLLKDVATLANGLAEEIDLEIERIEHERQEQKRIKELSQQATDNRRTATREQSSAGHQQTLFDFAAELSERSISGTVLFDVDNRQAERKLDEYTERSGRTDANNLHSDGKRVAEHIEFQAESNDVIGNRAESGRNSDVASSIPSPINYRLSDENFKYETGAKSRFKNNIEAIKLLFKIEEEKRPANEEEKAILSRYVGWGGLSQAFDPENLSWEKEFSELKLLLSDKEEYRLAKESVLNSFYTSKTVIDGIYAGLNRIGLTSGKILEPAMGVGNFIGLLPETFKANETYGVELDSITGKISKLLYPQTKIEIKGFEETIFANESFDAVITNVPFGNYKVFDKDYDKQNFFIHDYFIAKSLDKVRAGGVVAVVTSKGTMDKENSSVRQYIANRAELIGAIRLPNNAFKESANTEVTSDILFFKKRENEIDATDDWINTTAYSIKTDDKLSDEKIIQLNNYFASHPQQMLGVMVQEKSMYGSITETALLSDGRDLKSRLEEAVMFLPSGVYDPIKAVKNGEVALEYLNAADYDVKNHCYIFVDNNLYQRFENKLFNQSIAKTNVDRMKELINLRSKIRHILDIQIKNCSDTELISEQQKLTSMYDKFVRNYGIVNSRTNRSLFREDADFALLISIEDVNQITGEAKKTDIFSKRTIRPLEKITNCETALEGLQVCKNEKGVVDIKFIEKLTGKKYEDIISALGNLIYQNPTEQLAEEYNPYGGWETAAEYLSGNVKNKLKIAELAANENTKFMRNVDALRNVQPTPLEAGEISVRLGASWIDKKYYKQFILELLQVPFYRHDYVNLEYEKFTGEWLLKRDTDLARELNAKNVYGTDRIDAYRLFEHSLNLQTPSVYDTIKDSDGEHRVLNKPETIAAREKQRLIQESFKNWIFEDKQRRDTLVNKYNDTFNDSVLPSYDGSYLQFPEMNPLITLKDYQKDVVDRAIISGNLLLHHVVGAGKTFEMAAICMKMRQLGLAKKPMIVVPNHLTVQWANEFRLLYPNANLLIATKKDFEKTNRKKFVARVATGDWDAVVIAASSFEKIPISKERQQAKIIDEISTIEIGLQEAKSDREKKVTVKNLQRTLKNKRAILEKLNSDSKKDDLLVFEDLGVDFLCVDEAHRYKNKFIFTKMNNVAGISQAQSQRSSDMDMKCEYINEIRGGNTGIVFATGTPISNSMVEMYTMQSYLQREELSRKGMKYFDSWAANFGETVTALELAPSGQGYRSKTRFAEFVNLPELLKMYRAFADVKTADMLNLPIPEAEMITVTSKPSDEILMLNDSIVERSEKIANGQVKPEEDNMLVITHDGKSIALDPRCYDPTLPDNEMHKVNRCAEKVYKEWKDSTDKKGTQLVFSDLSTPKIDHENYKDSKLFDIYNDLKSKLVKLGIPSEEIAFIHDAKTDIQKQSIFDKIRNGNIRILIGSTEKCGAGTNIQNKLVALHHLDTPYRPSDLEQREGRILRQGNGNTSVRIYTYVTERTFDSYSYQILENKQRFISQLNNGDMSIRKASDIDEATLSFSEIKAITAANPKIKRKMEIDLEINRLNTLKHNYKNNLYRFQNSIERIPKQIAKIENQINEIQEDIVTRNAQKSKYITIGQKSFEERKDAGELLCSMVKSLEYVDKPVGKINGFAIIPNQYESFFKIHSVRLVGKQSYNVEISDSAVGSIQRIENALNGFENRVDDLRKQKERLAQELQIAEIEVEKPFEHEETLNSLKSEQAMIDMELDLNRVEIEVPLENESEEVPVFMIENSYNEEMIAV